MIGRLALFAALFAALLAALLAAAPALAQDAVPPKPPPAAATQALAVRNATASVLQRLHLNAPDAPRPGPDLLGAGVLRPGQTFRAQLPHPPECRAELRAVFEDGTEERRALDLCRPEPVEFSDAGLREIDLANDTDFELRELYVAPPGHPRGPDRLGASVVPALDGLRVRLRGLLGCEAEATAVFRAAPPETRRVDLCAQPARLGWGDPALPLREATLRNGTAAALREVYLREPGAPEWGADRLGAAVLGPGQSFLLRTRRTACTAELRAVFQTGREEVRRLDLCAAREIALLPARRTTLVHDHRRTVREAYLSPVEEADWGPDILGGRPLARGERREVGTDGTGCQADLRIVFDNGSAEELRGFDLCARPEIRLAPGWVAE